MTGYLQTCHSRHSSQPWSELLCGLRGAKRTFHPVPNRSDFTFKKKKNSYKQSFKCCEPVSLWLGGGGRRPELQNSIFLWNISLEAQQRWKQALPDVWDNPFSRTLLRFRHKWALAWQRVLGRGGSPTTTAHFSDKIAYDTGCLSWKRMYR